MNLRNVFRILIIGLFVSSLTGVVSAAPGTYDYTYEIDGQTYYQMGEFNQYPPFIMNPDVSGVYQNVAVYDSEGNFVGIGTITRFEGKMLHYSADIEWNEPEVPTTNNTNIDDVNNNATNNSTYQNTTSNDQANNGDDNLNQNNDTVNEGEEHLPQEDNTTNNVNGTIPMEETGNPVILLIITLIVITVVAYYKR